MGRYEYVYIGLYLKIQNPKFDWYEFCENNEELSDQLFMEPNEFPQILLINLDETPFKQEFNVGLNKIIDLEKCNYVSKIPKFKQEFKKVLDLFVKNKVQCQIKSGVINYAY